LEAVTFAGGLDEGGPVGEPVEGGAGEAFVAEHLGPVFKAEVSGEDDALPFVGIGNHVEEQFGAGLAGGDVAEFVEDEQVEPAELVPEAKQLAVLVGLPEGGYQFGYACRVRQVQARAVRSEDPY
jgi:hypothetical protein